MEDDDSIRKGLLLTAKEVGLFPSEMISPSLAIGTEKQKRTITYQLNVNICPHINDKNECLIYNKRPLMCKAFPFDSGSFSVRCVVFSNRKLGVLYCDFAPSESQIDASEKLNKYIRKRFHKHFTKGIKVWNFDLATKNWAFKAQYSNYPFKEK